MLRIKLWSHNVHDNGKLVDLINYTDPEYIKLLLIKYIIIIILLLFLSIYDLV